MLILAMSRLITFLFLILIASALVASFFIFHPSIRQPIAGPDIVVSAIVGRATDSPLLDRSLGTIQFGGQMERAWLAVRISNRENIRRDHIIVQIVATGNVVIETPLPSSVSTIGSSKQLAWEIGDLPAHSEPMLTLPFIVKKTNLSTALFSATVLQNGRRIASALSQQSYRVR